MPDPNIHRRRWWILAVLIVSLFTVNLDNTVLNVALPTLARELHAGTSQLQWMVDAYVLVFAGLLLAAGALGDRFGRRRILLAGLGLFGAGSLASAFAPSAEALIVLRAVMGVGGALIVPSTLSVTAQVFSLEERPKAIAIWMSVAGMGIVAGPVLAGWLLGHFAWGAIFLINVPVVVVSVVGSITLVPEARSEDAPGLDVPGTVLSIAGLLALVYGVIEVPANGWTAPSEIAVFALAGLLLTLFVVRELHAPAPLFDLRLLAVPGFAASIVAVLLTSFGLFGSMFFLSQYLQGVLGFGTIETGFSITPVAVALAIFSPLGMVVTRRAGMRTVVAAGMTAVAAGLLVLRGANVSTGYGPVAISLALVGGGMGFASSPVAVLMIKTLPRAQSGVASAINNAARELGGALGVAVLGSISAPVYAAGVRPAAALLPGEAGQAVHDSLAGAGVVAGYLPGPQGAALLDLARSAFIDGLALAVTVGAVVAIAGAAVAFAFLPGRAGQPAADDAPAADAPAAETGAPVSLPEAA
jgi:EmrB/QacA subfamily drug resistance transporter